VKLLEGKIALVAGVGPGLGAETALAFARAGAAVVLMARSTAFTGELAARIAAEGGRAEVFSGSVADPAACEAAVARARESFGGLDVLVNNAFHQGERTSALASSPEDWRQVLDVNLIGPLQMVKAAVPLMKARGGGSIIMVNSDQAWRVVPTFAAYSASKAALVSLTRHLAAELGESGIRVNCVHPGMIMADSLRRYFQELADRNGCSYQDIHDSIASKAALRYIPEAREMAGTLVFFASDLSRPITGQSLCVDGGTHFH